MTNNALSAAVLTAALAISSHALARAPAPLVPTALVEDVKSASADVEFMDYVGTGQVIKLEPSDVLVLSYLKSCEHETITGGTVRVGSNKSEVEAHPPAGQRQRGIVVPPAERVVRTYPLRAASGHPDSQDRRR
jgi:hypothetical protein